MAYVEVPGGSIHYETVGSGEPLMLIAGLGGTASFWGDSIVELAKHYQVVLHDHRGTGKSSRFEGEYTVELMAADALAVMNALKLDAAHIVGHSTGGAIGQVLAATVPQRVARLVLYASWAWLDPQMEMCLDLRRRILRAMGEAEYHRASPLFLYPPYYVHDNKAMLEAEVALAVANTSPKSILDARITGIIGFDGTALLSRIRCPTLVMVANDDILTPPKSAEYLAAHIEGARLLRFPQGGHAVSRTEPAAFDQAVLGFLAGERQLEEALNP